MPQQFPLILETLLTKPDTFIKNILPELNPLTEDKLEALSKILESGSVIDKQNVTKLFI